MSAHTPAADVGSLPDVLVIGAGPAGALAALLLARAGKRVLLVDRKPFPRYKVCGACLNERALAILRNVGLGERVHSLGGRPLNRVSFRSAGRTLHLRLPGGLAVARDRLDAALVEAAVSAGAAFLPETTAAVLPPVPTPFERCVKLTSSGRPSREIRARVVLAADGLGQSSLQLLPEFVSQIAPGSRIGLGTVIREFPSDYDDGTITLAVGRQGYVGLVRTEPSVLNVALAVEASFAKACGGPANTAAALLAAAGCPAAPALEQADWHGTVPLTRRPSSVAGHRLLLLGDSTGYIEPFTGEGMTWAFTAAEAVAPIAAAAIEEWSPQVEAAWTATCREQIGRRQAWCRLLSGLVRRPWATASMMAVLSRFPALARPLVERISGSPKLSWEAAR